MRPERFVNNPPSAEEKLQDDKEIALRKQLQSAQLRFADKAYRQQDKQTFAEILDQETPVVEELADFFYDAYPDEAEKLAPTYVEGVKQALNKIYADHPEDWELHINKFIEAEKNRPKKFHQSEQKVYSYIGPIAFEIVSEPQLDSCGDKYGLTSRDTLMEIHLESMYRFPSMDFTSSTIKKIFKEISVYLENNPNIKAVIGESWLVDHPIGRALGFQVIKEIETEKNGLGAWSQLITKEGNINEERLNQALEKGELPFKCVFGYIPREYFINRYGGKKESTEVGLP